MSDSDNPTVAFTPGPGKGWVYPDRLRLPLVFDAARLASDLAELADAEWTAHFIADRYVGDWSVLPLRAPVGALHPILQITAHGRDIERVDTEHLQRSPYLREVVASFACRTGSVRLLRLGPGSHLLEHNDPDLAAEYGEARLHIPISTNADVDFRLNGRRVDMLPGECWYLRLADLHSVRNDGDTDRVNLVIDCEVNPWLEALMTSASAAAA